MASLKTEVACRPLRYREIPRTVDVTERVFRDTPFFNYVFFPSPDARDPRVCKLGARLVTTIQNANYVSQKEAITVDGGDGFVTFVSPRNGLSPWRKIFQRMMQTLAFVFIFLITKLTSTEEQRQRMKETRQRNNALRGSVIGGQLDDVFLIDILAVSPDKQSLGPQTRPFYEKFGFAVVAAYSLGDKNPTWTSPPVQRVIMVREPTLLKDARGEEVQPKRLNN
ncbi:hypothetical protein BKA93DRAFT_829522 [Sparassis latifolia]